LSLKPDYSLFSQTLIATLHLNLLPSLLSFSFTPFHHFSNFKDVVFESIFFPQNTIRDLEMARAFE